MTHLRGPVRPYSSFTLAFAALFTLVACGDKAAAPATARMMYLETRSRDSVTAFQPQAPAQKLIRTGELRIEVANVDEAIAKTDSAVAARGGLVTDQQTSAADNGKRSVHLTLRVPSARFADFTQALKSAGSVKYESVSQEDVTKAYFDVETRLAVKEQALARLRQLLSTKTARLADVLDAEREISRTIGEIEELKGQRRFYDNQVALSTVSATFFEAGALASGPSFTVGQAFAQSLEVLSTSIAWLVYIVTFLVPWVVAAVVIWWLVRRLRKRTA